MQIPIEVSARHMHLKESDFQELFGKKTLSKMKYLSQIGEFASSHTVDVVGPKSLIKNVRIIGPFREYTQLELSITDAYNLGIKVPPIVISGTDCKANDVLKIKGEKKEITLSSRIIIAKRHLHISPEDAKKYNLINLQKIKIKVATKRSIIFEDVVVRIGQSKTQLSFQIDTDEANAAAISKNCFGQII